MDTGSTNLSKSQRMQQSSGHRSGLQVATLAVLFLFCATIAAMFIADLSYINLAAMRNAIASPFIRRAFGLSLVTSVVSMVLAVLVAIPAGYALSRYRVRGMIALDVLVDALIVLPVLVIGISLLVFFRQTTDLSIPGRRLLNGALALWRDPAAGAGLKTWAALPAAAGAALWGLGQAAGQLGNLFIYRTPGIVLAQFFCAVSFAVRVMKTTFDGLDPRVEQVALTLGCTPGQAFRRVTLPMARPGIMAAAVLSWTRAVGVYGPVYIVAGAVRGKTEVLPTTIFLEISIGQLETALSVSVILLVMACAVLLLLRAVSGASLFGAGGSR
jgi:molybdate transport system permease protein